MLGAMKVRDEHVYPLEGVDEAPKGPRLPSWSLREEIIPRLVQLLQDANRREYRTNRALEDLHRKYQPLEQENLALKYRDYCDTCQKSKETTPEGDTYTLCGKCSENQLAKKDKEIRHWQHCYETALGEQFPDTTLSQL